MSIILTTSGMLFPLVTVPYVSRVLSTYGLGAVSFAQSVMSYFLLVAQFGVTLYGVRVCAVVRDDRQELSRTVKELLVLLGVTAAVSFVAYVGAFFLVPRIRQEPTLHFMFGLVIWLGSFGVEWFYQALEQYDYITLRSVALKVVGLALMLVFVRGSGDYIAYGWIVILSGYGSSIINLLRLRKYCDLRRHESLHPLRHLKKMAWFAVASSSSNMYTQTDIILLGFLCSNSMVGVYQIVSKVESVLKSAVNSVGNVLLPRMSYYTSHGREDELSALMATTVNFAALASAAVIAGCTICADEIVGILGGERFAGAALPLVANGPAVFFAAMNIPLGGYLVAREGERKWALANGICLLISYAAGIPLVATLGMVGAGISVSVTEGAGTLIRGWFCRDMLAGIWRRVDVYKSFVAGATAAIVSWVSWHMLMPHVGDAVSLLFKGVTFCFSYALLLWALREEFFIDSVDRVLRRFARTKGWSSDD